MEKRALVDIDTGVVRRGRLLVQHGPDAVVFLGFGGRAAQLQRFAFGYDDDTGPFIERCREVAEAVERGSLQKATQLGIPHWIYRDRRQGNAPAGNRRIAGQGRV